jgi:probable F420-dependent oxidoreductase
MKFSVTYPLVSHPYDPELLEKASLIRFAETAESAGFDALGFTDHPAPSQKWLESGGHDALDPFAALAFCAAVTDRIHLMPHILVLPCRNPFVLAKAVATVDVLSGERFILGAAAGYLRSEYSALGVDFEERNLLFDEALDVLEAVWSEDDVRYQGTHFEARGVTASPKPARHPRPPLWIGENSKRARRRAAQRGDGWMPFHAPGTLARTAKTPVLETRQELAGCLDEFFAMLEDAGRDREALDVHYQNDLGRSPGTRGFEPDHYLEGISGVASLGVTLCSFPIPATGLAAAL